MLPGMGSPIIGGHFARSTAMTAETAAELHTIIDLIRYGTSRFN
ncbi:MAG TPA: 50S ribosomal protein L3 N(5)-glutamine methyltransferase, partial [Stenotrophomonas sp.]|nr:50S ribosomal protein L3 N(5)-glutamine methyltransferase [Stenotrophomonas sp.]